jgi:hypothetical protein
MGLLILISFVRRYFGPEAATPITPAVIAIFSVAVFVLLVPNPLKLR